MPRSLIPVSVADLLPAMVRGQLAKLPAEQQAEFVEEFRRKRKSTGLAYLLWFIIGLHYVYLGKLGWQIFYWLTFGGFLIWMFIDIFRMPSMVRNYNRDVAVDVFRTLKIITSD
ncbi:MAG: TM2 domain-containing protein [Dehalococcoidia bacterium]